MLDLTDKNPPPLAPVYKTDRAAIYCADAFDFLPRLYNLADVILTDPPYSSGGLFRGDRTGRTHRKYSSAKRPEFGGDTRDQRSYREWCAHWLRLCYKAARPGARLFVFCDWRQLPTVSDAVQMGGWIWRGILTWHKTTSRPLSGHFRLATEHIVYATHGPVPVTPGLPTPDPVYQCPPPRDRDHPVQKPVPLLQWLLSVVPPDSIVLDPFAGSGATLEAALLLGHRAIGSEYDRNYAEIAARRLSSLLPNLRTQNA